jgi:hypothetical protein
LKWSRDIVKRFLHLGAYTMLPTTWLANLLLEESKHLYQNDIRVHHAPCTRTSVASAWGSQKDISRAQ